MKIYKFKHRLNQTKRHYGYWKYLRHKRFNTVH